MRAKMKIFIVALLNDLSHRNRAKRLGSQRIGVMDQEKKI